MRLGAVLGLTLFLIGGLGTSGWRHADGPDQLDGGFTLTDASVDGDVTLAASDGDAVGWVRGPPAALLLHADRGVITLTTARERVLGNPLGGGIVGVVRDKSSTPLALTNVTIALAAASSHSVFAVAPDPGGRVGAALGRVSGEPFTVDADATGILVGDANQSYATVYGVAGPAFGVASRAGRGVFTHDIESLSGQGALRLGFDFVNLTALANEGTYDLVTGEVYTDTLAGGVALNEDRIVGTAVFEGATLRIGPGEDTGLVAAAPAYGVAGTLHVPRAEGQVSVANETRRVDGQSLHLLGNLTVTPRAVPAYAPTLLLAGRSYDADGSVGGQATAVYVDGQLVFRAQDQVVQVASIAALIAGALGFGYATLPKTLPLLIPAYSRLGRMEILDQRRRLRIYELIRDHPFIHLRDLERRTGFGYGCVVYHLDILRREGLVRSHAVGTKELFYVQTGTRSPQEMQRLALLAEPRRRHIVTAIASEGPTSQAHLRSRTGIDRANLSRHLRKLEHAGLVERDGAAYRVSPLAREWVARDSPAGAVATA